MQEAKEALTKVGQVERSQQEPVEVELSTSC